MDLLSSEALLSSSSRNLKTPSVEQWEAIRELVLRHWYEGDENLQDVIDRLRNYGLKVTRKTLKTKLADWDLRKNLTHEDARNLLRAFNYVLTSRRPDIVLIRGKVETLKRIQRHMRRGGKVCADQGQNLMADDPPHLSKVIVISQHPALKPQSALIMLGKLEAPLRELQRLVIGAKENDLCISDDNHIHWITSSVETSQLEQGFQTSIWEGVRAFEEGDIDWAGLCWRSAFLRLESLLWESDVEIWMSYIRCCVRLERFGLEDVGKFLHQKLRSWRSFLPILAPHRPLVFALTDVDFEDIVSGGLFLLEAQFRQFELLWPDHSNAHITRRLHVAEERLHQSCHERDCGLPDDDAFDTLAIKEQLREYLNAQINHISARTLAGDYQKAEQLATACILDLEARAGYPDVDPLVHMMIPRMYNLLGGVQYSQECYEKAHESFTRSVAWDQDFAIRYNERAFGPFRLHRTFTILLWLEKQDLKTSIVPVDGLSTYLNEIERNLAVEVNRAENNRVRLGVSKQIPHRPRNKQHAKFATRRQPLRSPQVAFDQDKTYAKRRGCGGVPLPRKSLPPKPLPLSSKLPPRKPLPPKPMTPWS